MTKPRWDDLSSKDRKRRVKVHKKRKKGDQVKEKLYDLQRERLRTEEDE